jgi:putative ABC transport system permease protein
MALGAQQGQLLQLMLMDGLRPALFGLGLGLVMSFAATRIFQSMLFGTKPLDPVVLSGVIATLLAVAVLACLACFPIRSTESASSRVERVSAV